MALFAIWCGACGALKLEEGPVASQWLLPKTALVRQLAERMRRHLDQIDRALDGVPEPELRSDK